MDGSAGPDDWSAWPFAPITVSRSNRRGHMHGLPGLSKGSHHFVDALDLSLALRFIGETTRLEAVRDRDYDGLESDLRTVARWRSWTWKGGQRTTFGNRSRDEVLALRDQAEANLDAFIEASDADLSPLLHDALQTPIAAYEALKAKAGRLDFLDLLIKARDLIRDSPAVRGELQRRISQHDLHRREVYR